MSYIYLPETARLKSFASSSRSTRGTVRIEIECSDMDDFGYLLKKLVEMESEQKRPGGSGSSKKGGSDAA